MSDKVRRPYDVGDMYRGLTIQWVDRVKRRMGCIDGNGQTSEFPWSPKPVELYEVVR